MKQKPKRVVKSGDPQVCSLLQFLSFNFSRRRVSSKNFRFLGLNIALSQNLIGSYDVDFQKDSESGLKSKNTKESFI